MRCVYCGEPIKESMTTFTHDFDSGCIIVRNVPCQKCTCCNNVYFNGEIFEILYLAIQRAESINPELCVLNWQHITLQ